MLRTIADMIFHRKGGITQIEDVISEVSGCLTDFKHALIWIDQGNFQNFYAMVKSGVRIYTKQLRRIDFHQRRLEKMLKILITSNNSCKRGVKHCEVILTEIITHMDVDVIKMRASIHQIAAQITLYEEAEKRIKEALPSIRSFILMIKFIRAHYEKLIEHGPDWIISRKRPLLDSDDAQLYENTMYLHEIAQPRIEAIKEYHDLLCDVRDRIIINKRIMQEQYDPHAVPEIQRKSARVTKRYSGTISSEIAFKKAS